MHSLQLFLSKFTWREKCLWTLKKLVSQLNILSIRHDMRDFLLRFRKRLHLSLEVIYNIALVFLGMSCIILLSFRDITEGAINLVHELDEVLREVASGNGYFLNGVAKCKTLVNRHSVCNCVAGVDDDTGGTS